MNKAASKLSSASNKPSVKPKELTHMPDQEALIPNRSAAQRLGLQSHTLDIWHLKKTYADVLPRLHIGRRAYYRLSDLNRFIQLTADGAFKRSAVNQ